MPTPKGFDYAKGLMHPTAKYMLWFEFIFGLIFANQFKFFKLVHIFQTWLKFLNQFNFQF